MRIPWLPLDSEPVPENLPWAEAGWPREQLGGAAFIPGRVVLQSETSNLRFRAIGRQEPACGREVPVDRD